MMSFVGPLAMEGGGVSPGSLRYDRNCWNTFKLISGDATGGAESGPVY